MTQLRIFVGACSLALTIGGAAIAAGGSGGGSGGSDTPTMTILEQDAANPKLFSFDYGIPNSPALTLAGLASGTIKPSTSLKPFVFALPGLLGDGSSQTSVALDVAPAWALGTDRSVSAEDYASDVWEQLGARTRLGLVIYKGDDGGGDASKQKASRLAFGFSTSLLRDSDPLATLAPNSTQTVWLQCIDDNKGALAPYEPYGSDAVAAVAVRDRVVLIGYLHKADNGGLDQDDLSNLKIVESQIKDQLKPSDFDGRDTLDTKARLLADQKDITDFEDKKDDKRAAADTKAAKILDDCRKKASDAAQHGADLGLGFGVVWSGTPGKLEGFDNANAAVWISGRLPFSLLDSSGLPCESKDSKAPKGEARRSELACWVIGGTGRYSNGEIVQTGIKATPQFKADVTEGWIGLERIDSQSMFGAYVGYQDQAAVDPASKSLSRTGVRWLVSGAFSLDFIQDGLWVIGSYGKANGSVSTLDDKVAMLTLSFGPPKIGSDFTPKSSGGNGSQ